MKVLETQLPLKFSPVLLVPSATIQPTDFFGPFQSILHISDLSYELKELSHSLHILKS